MRIINGLPKFLQSEPVAEQFETRIEIPTAPDLVIDNRVIETARDLQTDVPLRRTEPPDQVVVLDASPAADNVESRISPEQIASVSVQVPNIPVAVQPAADSEWQPRYHVVQSGENLPLIAKQYYGPEDGNRRIVIQKLYEANSDILDSPDKIRVNDKLVIPPLEQLLNDSNTTLTASAQTQESSLLSRFAEFFEPVDSDKPARLYVVQKGESLWGIAQKTLGDGRRYKEILKLNGGIKNPDDVRVGMTLKIPQS